MSDHSFGTEVFPNIQSKPPLMQLEAIDSHPIASYVEEDSQALSILQRIPRHHKMDHKVQTYSWR